jgi:hypothetical protein
VLPDKVSINDGRSPIMLTRNDSLQLTVRFSFVLAVMQAIVGIFSAAPSTPHTTSAVPRGRRLVVEILREL